MITLEDIEMALINAVGEIEGTDTEDAEYSSILDLWSNELSRRSKKPRSGEDLEWYEHAYNYWESPENCPVSDDGVLGGYGMLTPIDARGSKEFIESVKKMFPYFHLGRVADCGAGIGRVTKNFLLPIFEHVDLIEQSPRLLSAAPKYIGEESTRVTCICSGLQSFNPSPKIYDAVWIQWVIGHLHDIDFIQFFKRCVSGLKPGGLIFLKENCPADYTFVLDKDDSSVSRSIEYIKLLLSLADLEVVLIQQQKDFPSTLYPVYMFAAKPKL